MDRRDALLGLDIGGTKCAALVGTANGDVLAREQWDSAATRGPAAMIADFIAAGRRLVEQLGPVHRVGVSIGGPLDSERGIVHGPPNLPGWDGVPLKVELEAALGLPVRVEHDAAACALAEFRWGLGRDLPRDGSLVYLTCGTGMGAGLVLRGRVHRGAGGRSPELGHIRLTDTGPTAFGKAGCVEAWCAGSSLPRIAGHLFTQRWSADPPDGRQLVELAAGRDVDAVAVLDCHARMTGRAAAMLGDLLVPDIIALGSLARYLPEPWLTTVRQTFAEECLPAVTERCVLAPAGLGERLQDCSAIAAALGDD